MNLPENPDIDQMIARYLSGHATEGEIDRLIAWIESSPDNRREFFAQKDIWHALHPGIRPEEIDLPGAERRVKALTRSKLRRFLAWLPKIAAACIVPLLFAIMGFYLRGYVDAGEGEAEYTVSTAYGYTMETVLPDNSRVWLNANSTLTYPARFSGTTREVTLKGEGFFEVDADKSHPFLVHTPDVTVTATGTQFNVNAYEDTLTSVTLVEGKVRVKTDDHVYRLSEGEHMWFANGKASVRIGENIAKYCSWRDGILIFDNDPLSAICTRLQQIQNVEFDVAPEVAKTNFHIILKGENIREILHMLELSAPIRSEIYEHTDSLCNVPHLHIDIRSK